MKRAQAIAGIAVMLLLAGCADAPGHAPPRGRGYRKAQPARHLPSVRALALCRGERPLRLDVPCAQTLLVPVTTRHPRPGQPRTFYRRRPCWCG
jgi:hypothetical protein